MKYHYKLKLISLSAFIIITLFIVESFCLASPEKSYKVSISFILNNSIHGVDGKLLLLQDVNLTSNKSVDYLEKENKLQNAILKIIDSDENTISSTELDKPFAELKEEKINNHHFYFLTVDYSLGFGSYAGPTTTIFKVENAKISWQEAIDIRNKEKHKIFLESTLKTAWKILHKKNITKIFQVKCRPDLNRPFIKEGSFLVTYETYIYDGQEWHKKNKVIKSFWENEGTFPDLSLFP